MERKFVRLACLAALALTLLTAWAQTPPAVQKVSVVPSPVNARIVLDCGAPLPALASSYAPGASPALQVEFGPAKWPALPALPSDGTPLIKDLKLAVQANGRSLLTVGLTEPVPYRIFSDGPRTVIELEKIVRGGDYPIAPETQKELAASDRTTFEIGPVDVSPAGDGLSVAASPGRSAVANIFALEHPLRLVIDVFDSTYSGRTDKRAVGKFAVEGVKIGQFMVGQPYTITRMVFDLKEPRSFNLASGPADFRVSFPGAAAAVGAPAATAGATVAPVNKPVDSPLPKNDTPAPNSTPPAPSVAVNKPADLPAAKTDTSALKSAPPAASASVDKPAGSPVPKIETPAPKVSPSAASDPNLTLASIPASVKGETKAAVDDPPQTAKPAPAKAETEESQARTQKYRPLTINNPQEKYSGEPISPRFKDADIRDVIMWLGETFGLNVMFDDEVKGTVTCNFADIPWDQFLDIILKNKRLGKSLDGNVLRIAPLATLTQEETDQQKLRDTKENGGPLLTKTYPLSYAKARDVMELLKARKSDRGQLVVDDRTNTIILTDTKDKLDLIEKLIEVLDTATPQVSIEARIVEATSNFVRNLGIQWGAKGIADPFYGNQTSLQFPNKVLLDGAMIPEGQVTKGIAGPLGGYAINLPAPAFSTALGFSFANVLDTLRLDVALTALESNGNGRIISTPKVVTQNNKTANVIRGRQIPVQTTANFTVTTQYINAALELKATPQITAEGTIIMDLEIQNNAADFANLVNGIPPITTQSAKTTVMVPDGGTTVIGGIFRVEDSITTERVPFLYQIPILGALFKNFARTKQNQELLIFITPRIIR